MSGLARTGVDVGSEAGENAGRFEPAADAECSNLQQLIGVDLVETITFKIRSMDSNTKISVSEVIQRVQALPYPDEVLPCLDTQYSKISNENFIASRREFPTIDGIISERKAQIDDIDAIIEQAAIVLERFREQRKRTVSSMTMHEGLMSCVRRLPSDVLEDIFVHCLPSETHNKPTVWAAPLLLTWICRSWREVALNTSRLWSSLVIKRTLRPEQLSSCHSWLKKAKGLPLSLGVQTTSDPNPANAVLDLLQVYTSRLKNLVIDFGVIRETYRSGLLLSDLPILERLSLVGYINALILSQALSIAQQQPRFHTLSIHAWSLGVKHFPIPNPGWTNITRLALVLGRETYGNSIGDFMFLTLLKTCPNLDHLVFFPVEFFFREGSVPSPFTHPKLRLLDIAVTVAWYNSPLHTLTLPNLRYIHVRSNVRSGAAYPRPYHVPEDIFALKYPLPEEQQHRILNMQIHSYMEYDGTDQLFTVLNPGWTALTHIRINAAYESLVFRVLALCPNLEDLVIPTMDIAVFGRPEHPRSPTSHPILRSLNICIAEGNFCDLLGAVTFPSLTRLEIALPEDQCWPDEEFESFLSRSQCPLETLEIKVSPTRVEEREACRTPRSESSI